jgi:8-oxo-dGTP pyrophosphatase MutT (NUDIX family)
MDTSKLEKKIAEGAFVICPKTENFLTMLRRDNVAYPNMWGLPGGHFDEEDMFPKVTALREFKEETGYNSKLKISKQPIYTEKTNHLEFFTYIILVKDEFVPNMRGECEVSLEHLDYIWKSVYQPSDIYIPNINYVISNKKENIRRIINKFGNF